MVVAGAALRDQVAIVLQHVQVVVLDDALYFSGEVLVRGGNAEIDGLALELFGLPVGRNVGDQPVAHFGIMYV